MTSGTRLPTWKERENNKRRERRRRAIASKIFSGLRMYGNYKLPKHCDNNEVLKALCNEAGWIVEEDGTTYRKGCKPVEHMNTIGASATVSHCPSYQPSPGATFNPSPTSSSFPSPVSSQYATNVINTADPNSLLPWLKNLSSGSSLRPFKLRHICVPGGSISAPVTPPLSSPTARTPRMKANWDNPTTDSALGGQHYSFLPSSTPSSPGHQTPLDSGWLSGFDQTADVAMSDAIAAEFAFGSNTKGLVKPWEGEIIHDECVPDDLELTLGNSSTS
ncbi:unnamed protein product [Fraxinus pennsylvanica]|uniref:Protein BZR1 homolog n=1 Tax=Fraxinus pennsylvanica TaxID=56036 RepID=A0AAD2EFT8_9LAMI|nr:unnamed protein product [Fraxinus pennsylvanica]